MSSAMTTLVIGLALIAAAFLCYRLMRREPEPTSHVFRTAKNDTVILLVDGTFKHKTANGWKIRSLRHVLPLFDAATQLDIVLAHNHVRRYGYPSSKTFVSRQQADSAVASLRQFQQERTMSNKPRSTGRTYTARNGRVYHQMTNGQYATNNNDTWDFVTYIVLLDLLVGTDDASRLQRDHQAYVADNGAPASTPAASTPVVSGDDTPSSGGGGDYTPSSCSSGGGSSCSSGSSCSGGGGGCGGV